MEDGPVLQRAQHYDICIEQVENLALTVREEEALDAYAEVSPIYRLRVKMLPEGAQIPEPEEESDEEEPAEEEPVDVDEDEEYLFTEEEPDGTVRLAAYPDGARLSLKPMDEWTGAPEDAQSLFVSTMLSPEDSDVIEALPAEFTQIAEASWAEIAPAANGLYGVVQLPLVE